MDVRTEDHQYPLYLPALPFGRAMSTSPLAAYLPDPLFMGCVPLDYKKSSNNVTWIPDFLVRTGVHSSSAPE